MAYDLGDLVTLTVNVKDSSGNLANAGAITLTITLPDGTTTTPSNTNSSTGVYTATYTPTQVGRHGVRWVATGANSGAYTDVFEVLDPAYLPLVSLADLKSHMQVTSSTTDETVRFILARATSIAESYCGQAFVRQTAVETYDGGWTAISLRTPPVISVTSVTENGNTLTAGSEYIVNNLTGTIYRGSSLVRLPFYPGRQNIVITYVAGYANPPLDAQHAVMDIARWIYQQTQQGPRPGFGQSAQEFTGYGADALPTWLMRPLDTYVLPGIA